MKITRELVRDPYEIVFADGKRYATQRWITRCQDIRHFEPFSIFGAQAEMSADFGWIDIGPAFPTEDSVSSPFYEPPKRGWLARIMEAFR